MTRMSERPTTANSTREPVGVDPGPAMRARLASGIALSMFSLLVIIGMPIFLTQVVGSTWPARWPALADLRTLHLRNDTELLYGGIGLAGWALWIGFTLLVLYALIGAIADALRWGVTAETWRDASNPVRWLAGLLIGAIAALWPAAAHAAPPEPVDQTVASRTLTDDELAHLTSTNAPESPPVATAAQTGPGDNGTGPVTHTISPTDSLYSLADQYLGNGDHWPEIWETNQGAPMSNGQPFTDPDFVTDGTVLTIPTDATAAPSGQEDPNKTIHIVQTGQHLYGLAEDYYGDGEQWSRIWEANQGRTFADGRTFTDPDRIFTDWDLQIPADNETAQPDDSEPEPGSDDSAEEETGEPGSEPEPDAGAELEGEGEITDPNQSATATPEKPEAPPAAGGSATTPADAPESNNDANPAAAANALPVGVWLGTGTFLAASTVALLIARAKRRKRRDSKGNGEDRPVTGRLADLEAMIDLEQHRLTEHAAPELTTEHMVAPDQGEPDLAFGANRTRPVDLADLAAPALGLTGPGHKAAVRAAIITALDTDHPITATMQAADLLDIEPDTGTGRGPVSIADDLTDACDRAAEQQAEEYRLLICTSDDIAQVGVQTIAEHLALHSDRIIVLGECTLGPTATLAADGTLEAATGSIAGIKQCYTAEAALFHEVLADHTAAALEDIEPTGQADDAGATEPAPAPDEQAAEVDPKPKASANAPAGAGFRLCVFGDLDLYYNGVPVKLKQHARALTLLAALASADEGRTMDELLDIVTPDRPLKGAREYVNIIKSNLRATIRDLAGDDTLDPVPYDEKTATFRLDTGIIGTDLADFDEAEQQAVLATSPAEQAHALEQLVRLHTGDLTPDIETLDELRTGYRAATHRACRTLANYHAENGDPARAAKYRAMLPTAPEADNPDKE
jgi:nucleoid-associated protein YgaU